MHKHVGSHDRSPSPSQASCDISEMTDRVREWIKAAAFKPNCIYIFMMCDKLFRTQSKPSDVPPEASPQLPSVLLPGGLLPCPIIKWLSARRHHSQMFIPHEPLGFLLLLTAARLFPDVCLPHCSQTADGLSWYSPAVRPVRGWHDDTDYFSRNTSPPNLKWVFFSFTQWSSTAQVEL